MENGRKSKNYDAISVARLKSLSLALKAALLQSTPFSEQLAVLCTIVRIYVGVPRFSTQSGWGYPRMATPNWSYLFLATAVSLLRILILAPYDRYLFIKPPTKPL